MRRTFTLALTAALAWALTACDSGTEPPVATSIELTLPAQVTGGEILPVQARVLDQRGQVMPDAPLGFGVQTPEHGVVVSGDLVALRPGTLVIRVASRELSVERSVTVVPGPAPDVPETVMLGLGDTLDLSGPWGALGHVSYDLETQGERAWNEGLPVLDADGAATGFGTIQMDASAHGGRAADVQVRVTAEGPVVVRHKQAGDTLTLTGYRMDEVQGVGAGGADFTLLAGDSAQSHWRVPETLGSDACTGTAQGAPVALEGAEALEDVRVRVPREGVLEMEVGEIRMLGRGEPCLRFPEGEGDEVYGIAILDAWDLDQAAADGYDVMRYNNPGDLVAHFHNRTGLVEGEVAVIRSVPGMGEEHAHPETVTAEPRYVAEERTYNQDQVFEPGDEFEASRWFSSSGLTTYRVIGVYEPNLVAIAPVPDLEAFEGGPEVGADSIDFAMRHLEETGYEIIASAFGHPTMPVSNPATGQFLVHWEVEESLDSFGRFVWKQPMDGYPDRVRGIAYVRLEARGSHGFVRTTATLFHEMGHAFQIAYRGDWLVPQHGYWGSVGQSGEWAREGNPHLVTGEASRQIAGLEPMGNYDLHSDALRVDSWGHNTVVMFGYGGFQFQAGYRHSAPFLRYLVEQIHRTGLGWEEALRRVTTGAEGGWTGRSLLDPNTQSAFELPSLAETMETYYPGVSMEDWHLRWALSRTGDSWTDNPLLEDGYLYRPVDHEWFVERDLPWTGRPFANVLGYVRADETPGWTFEGMFGSGLWTWVHDQGVGGSYLIETNRDPGTISVGVARLR